jgi:hypothetical protein
LIDKRLEWCSVGVLNECDSFCVSYTRQFQDSTWEPTRKHQPLKHSRASTYSSKHPRHQTQRRTWWPTPQNSTDRTVSKQDIRQDISTRHQRPPKDPHLQFAPSQALLYHTRSPYITVAIARKHGLSCPYLPELPRPESSHG